MIRREKDKPIPGGLPFGEVKPVDPHVRKQDVARLTKSNARLIEALRAGPLTARGAMLAGLTDRLAARVHDLKEAGYGISDKWAGNVKEYRLISEPKHDQQAA